MSGTSFSILLRKLSYFGFGWVGVTTNFKPPGIGTRVSNLVFYRALPTTISIRQLLLVRILQCNLEYNRKPAFISIRPATLLIRQRARQKIHTKLALFFFSSKAIWTTTGDGWFLLQLGLKQGRFSKSNFYNYSSWQPSRSISVLMYWQDKCNSQGLVIKGKLQLELWVARINLTERPAVLTLVSSQEQTSLQYLLKLEQRLSFQFIFYIVLT